MKQPLLFLCLAALLLLINESKSQIIDTIAIQDFETVAATPTWNYTGTLAGTQSGYAGSGSCIPGTPLGIGGSTAWHVAAVSGGNPIVFNNTTIGSNYDSVWVSFKVAALSLNSSTGGPDHLDYVLVEYSLNGGSTYVARVRVRGAVNNNSFWPYTAATEAVVDYLPATEQVFQPTNSGLQLTDGISRVEIGFPGSIGQIAVRITPRSSSSSDSWLIDNVLLTGKLSCSNSTGSITATECDAYTAPSGAVFTTSGTHTDIIPNSTGCDSVISIDLTINESDFETDTVTACESYTAPSGAVYTSSGDYLDSLQNTNGCDSVIAINLTIDNGNTTTDMITACGSHTWMDGNTYTESNNTATFVLTNMNGCDSTIELDLIIIPLPDISVTQSGATLISNATGASYQWLDCKDNHSAISGETGTSFTATSQFGSYAVEVTQDGCVDTSSCYVIDFTGVQELLNNSQKQLVKIIDFLGRETEFKTNTPQIFIYDDGTRERYYIIEN